MNLITVVLVGSFCGFGMNWYLSKSHISPSIYILLGSIGAILSRYLLGLFFHNFYLSDYIIIFISAIGALVSVFIYHVLIQKKWR